MPASPGIREESKLHRSLSASLRPSCPTKMRGVFPFNGPTTIHQIHQEGAQETARLRKSKPVGQCPQRGRHGEAGHRPFQDGTGSSPSFQQTRARRSSNKGTNQPAPRRRERRSSRSSHHRIASRKLGPGRNSNPISRSAAPGSSLPLWTASSSAGWSLSSALKILWSREASSR